MIAGAAQQGTVVKLGNTDRTSEKNIFEGLSFRDQDLAEEIR